MSPETDIDFDPDWYAGRYPDVALSGLDPREHFRRFGRAMGRSGTPQTAAAAERAPAGVLQRPPPGSRQTLRLMSGESEIARIAEAGALVALVGPLSTCGRMLRLDGAAGVVRLHRSGSGAGPLPEATGIDCGAADWLLGGGHEGLQLLRLTVDAGAEAGGEGLVLRGFQADPAAPHRLQPVGAVILSGAGPVNGRLQLRDALMPLVLEVSEAATGLTRDIALLPFPSLLPGGLHAAERAVWQDGPDAMAEVRRLGTALLRELLDETGAPFAVGRIDGQMPEPLRGWLAAVFGLEAGRTGALALTLPPGAAPSLGALASRRMRLPAGQDRAAGPYLLAEEGTMRPLWSVALPASAVSDPLPPMLSAAGAGQGDAPADGWLAPLPLAVIPMPQPPAPPEPARPKGDVGDIDLCLTVTAAAAAERCLRALAWQAGVTVTSILLCPAEAAAAPELARAETAAQTLFPDARVRAGEAAASLDGAARTLAAERILLVEDRVLPDDPGTVAVLAELLDSGTAASAACALIERPEEGAGDRPPDVSAGLFPVRVSLVEAPHLGVATLDALSALPAARYPVLANTFQLCLVRRRAILETAAARAETGAVTDLAFGLDCADSGWNSLCTTTVRAGYAGALVPRDEIDPLALARLRGGGWDAVLGRVTVLTRLHG